MLVIGIGIGRGSNDCVEIRLHCSDSSLGFSSLPIEHITNGWFVHLLKLSIILGLDPGAFE